MAVWCAPWSPAEPRTSLYLSVVLLFVSALLSWRPVLATRRILGVIGGGFVCSVGSPAGPRKSLDSNGVLLFVGALLSWRPVLANRRILWVIGGGFVCSVVAGGAQKIAVL